MVEVDARTHTGSAESPEWTNWTGLRPIFRLRRQTDSHGLIDNFCKSAATVWCQLLISDQSSKQLPQIWER